jgi:hypothetical protein
MSLQDKLGLCSENYQKWKNMALNSKEMVEGMKCMDRAFFWLELQTAFITLFSVERAGGDGPETELKIITAKANLSRRLADYAKEIIRELETE